MTHSDIDKKLSSILKKCQDSFSEKLVELCRHPCADCGGALKFGSDEPCDLVLGSDAIDMKYRVGSGDSGTLKKFQQYAALLKQNGYRPVFLFLRGRQSACCYDCMSSSRMVYVHWKSNL